MLKNKFLTLALATTVAALATAGSAQAATDYFLKVTPAAGTSEPIVGETADRDFPGAIEIESFSFGAENTATIGSATSGAGVGKATFQEFTIEKAVDSTTPRLVEVARHGHPLRHRRADRPQVGRRRPGHADAHALPDGVHHQAGAERRAR